MKLREQLSATLAALSIPVEYRRLDIAAIGAMLRVKPSTVRKYIAQPNFPKPRRDGHPRWLASEVHDWWLRERDKAA